MKYKKYNQQELLQLFMNRVVEQTPHKYYEHTVQHAEWCKRIMTGDDQASILISYRRREDDAQKEQRVHITKSRTQYVGNKVFTMFNEVHRSDRTQRLFRAKGDTSKFMDNIKRFDGEVNLESYLDEVYHNENFYDPNSFIVVEFENTDPLNKPAKAYPLVVNSEYVYDYEYDNGCLQYLVVRLPHTARGNKDASVTWYSYTLYASGFSAVIDVVPENTKYEYKDGVDYNATQLELDGKLTKVVVGLQLYDNTGFEEEPPATPIGYIKDARTNWETYVSPMFMADKVLIDLIWKKSEYDLAHALHGFYQKFMYVDTCSNCKGDGFVYSVVGGVDGNIQCPKCHGSGASNHTSSQDVIEIIKVETKEQHIPLNEFVHYEMIPMALIKQQKEDVRDLERDVFASVFSSNVLERSEIAVTATEKNYDWRNVDNALLSYSAGYVKVLKSVAGQVAAVHRVNELTIDYAFPASFSKESINERVARRKAAVDAGAPYSIINAIDVSILELLYKDNPEKITEFIAVEQHRPLREKSQAERQLMLSQLQQNDPVKVLYLNFQEVINETLTKHKNFSELEFGARKQLIDNVLEPYIAKAEPVTLFDARQIQ